MVSCDVSNFFSNASLTETVDIAVKLLIDNKTNIRMTSEELEKLFNFVTAKSHIYLMMNYWTEFIELPWGLPLAPCCKYFHGSP